MLRLRPTVISLTPSDVTEVVHRRRFQRFLQCEDDDQCLASTPVETRAIRNTARPMPSSSRTVNHEATPTKHKGSPLAYGRVRPLVVDLPLLLPPDKRAQAEPSLPLEDAGRQASHSDAGESRAQGSAWSPELCLRPKRNPSVKRSADGNVEADNSPALQDSPGNSALEQPISPSPSPTRQQEPLSLKPTERAATARQVCPFNSRTVGVRARLTACMQQARGEAGPSTPRSRSSSGSSGSQSTVAVFPSRVCLVECHSPGWQAVLTRSQASPEPVEGSDRGRTSEASLNILSSAQDN